MSLATNCVAQTEAVSVDAASVVCALDRVAQAVAGSSGPRIAREGRQLQQSKTFYAFSLSPLRAETSSRILS